MKLFESRLHASGTGTWIECAPAFNTSMPITVKKLTLTILDEKKNPVSKPVTLRENSFVPVRAQPFEPVTFLTETELKGVWFKFEVLYEGGGKEFSRTQLIPWGKVTAPVPGPEAGQTASASPYLSSYAPDKTRGNFTLWFKPEWGGHSWSDAPRWLLHAGAARSNFSWIDGIFLSCNRKWQTVEFKISNRKYESRIVAARVPFKKGTWVKLECSWDFTGAQSVMTVKAYGKTVSGPVTDGRGKPAAASLKFPGGKILYPAFIGAKNNGEDPALGAIFLQK